jgi:hypothetical protein
MRPFTGWIRLALALVLAIVAAGAMVDTAAAADTAPAPKLTTGDFERSYQHRMQDIVATERAISDGEGYAAQLDTIIAQLTAKGEDTKPLAEAVTLFRAQLGRLRTENTAVMTLLTTDSGFNLDGKVIDKGVARLTMKRTKGMLETIDGYLQASYNDLHQAIQDYHNTLGETNKFREPPRP